MPPPDDKPVFYTSKDPPPSLRERLTPPDAYHRRVIPLGAVYLFGMIVFFFLPHIIDGRYQAPATISDFLRIWLKGFFDISVYTKFLAKPTWELYAPGIACMVPWLLAFPIVTIVIYFGLGIRRGIPQALLLLCILAYMAKAYGLYYVKTLPYQSVGPFGALWVILLDMLLYIVALLCLLVFGLYRNQRPVMMLRDLYRRARSSPTAMYAIPCLIGALMLAVIPVIYDSPAKSTNPFAVFIHFLQGLLSLQPLRYILWPPYWHPVSAISAGPWTFCAFVVYLLIRFRVVSWRGGCSAVLVSWIWDVSFKSYCINLNVIAKDGLGMGLTFIYSPFMVLGIIVVVIAVEHEISARILKSQLENAGSNAIAGD